MSAKLVIAMTRMLWHSKKVINVVVGHVSHAIHFLLSFYPKCGTIEETVNGSLQYSSDLPQEVRICHVL